MQDADSISTRGYSAADRLHDGQENSIRSNCGDVARHDRLINRYINNHARFGGHNQGDRTMGKINCSIEQLPFIAAGLIREGMLFEVLVDDENALITITGH